MNKNKRKVTVDADDRKKPSVFERLGTGAVRRPQSNFEESDSDVRNACKKFYYQYQCFY